MPEMVSFIKDLLILYATALVGYMAKKHAILGRQADRALTQIILYITLPALILYSMDIPFSTAYLMDFAILASLSAFILGCACILAFFLARKTTMPMERKGVYQGILIFGNQGFLGYAVCGSLLGKEGTVYTAVFNIIYLILIWTYAIYLVARGRHSLSRKFLIFSPGILATACGLLIFFLPVGWPGIVSKFLQNLGTPTMPLSMLLIGSIMANIEKEDLIAMFKSSSLWISSAFKLLALPLLLLPFAFTDIKFSLLAVAVLVTGMPSAPTIPIYAEKYGADAAFGSAGVCLSTFLSVITLPLLYTLLRALS